MNTIELVKKLTKESVKYRTLAQGESIGVSTAALAKSDAYNHAIQIVLGCNYEPGKVITKDEFVDVAKEFFGWFNKTYPNQCSNNSEHPWCKMGEAICNVELCGSANTAELLFLLHEATEFMEHPATMDVKRARSMRDRIREIVG